MALSPVAGSKISIATAIDVNGDLSATDFTSLTWVEIGGWVERGSYGDTAALITEPLINEKRDDKAKGTRNAGSMQNMFVIKKGAAVNPGIAALAAAAASDSSFAFKVENNDKPAAGASPKNSVDYFAALVMSAQVQGGGANVNRKISATLEIVSNIVNVAASAT